MRIHPKILSSLSPFFFSSSSLSTAFFHCCSVFYHCFTDNTTAIIIPAITKATLAAVTKATLATTYVAPEVVGLTSGESASNKSAHKLRQQSCTAATAI